MKKQVFIIDTSAILSGKPIEIQNGIMLTASGVSDELSPGGRDYQIFQLLQGKGLRIQTPTKQSLGLVKKSAKETGDDQRLSSADLEILALALDVNADDGSEAMILTDDYSIQNVAVALHLKFQGFSQKEITSSFQWISSCPGCKWRFQNPVAVCPVCGTKTTTVVQKKKKLLPRRQ
jgi:UPF0271 protein